MSRAVRRAGAAALLCALACRSAPTAEPAPARVPALGAGEQGVAVRCGRVVTVDGEARVHAPGMVVSRAGKLVYVGPPVEVPAGYRVVDAPAAWAVPGFVDLHTHVHSGGWGDINEGMDHVAPGLTAAPALVPCNDLLKRACAGGVTTLFGIPGSATSLSGFGVLYKSKTSGGFEDVVVANPGGLKIAQTHNPQRNPNMVLRSWAGLGWVLEKINDEAVAALEQDRFDPRLESLKRVHAKELPVLIHCAAAVGVADAARMWRVKYDTRAVISHGSFNGWRVAPWIAELGVPVNHGPRTMDYFSSRTGAVEPTAYAYWKAGVPDFSLNTDSQIVPQEELFLQAAMAAREGVDGYEALRAVTINPARSFGIDGRVGSLEVGKDADVVLWTGDPLDPRSRVELVLIEGEVQYDRKEDGQWS